MREAAAKLFIEGLKSANINLLTVLADSWLFEPYRQARADQFFSVIPVANEGEGVGICAGAWLGGKKSAILMENSGLRTACEPLARLQGIPVLLLMSYRGDWGDAPWWAANTGATTEPILNALKIPFKVVRQEPDIVPSLTGAVRTMSAHRSHAAVLFGGELM